MAEYMRAEDRLAALLPGLVARPAPVSIEVDLGLGASALGALGSSIAAALSALANGGSSGAAAASQQDAAAGALAARLRELRLRLPTAADRETLVSEYSAWLDGLRKQLVAQHDEAHARLEALRAELAGASGDLRQSEAAVEAVRHQQRLLESAKWRALTKFEEAQVGMACVLDAWGL